MSSPSFEDTILLTSWIILNENELCFWSWGRLDLNHVSYTNKFTVCDLCIMLMARDRMLSPRQRLLVLTLVTMSSLDRKSYVDSFTTFRRKWETIQTQLTTRWSYKYQVYFTYLPLMTKFVYWELHLGVSQVDQYCMLIVFQC